MIKNSLSNLKIKLKRFFYPYIEITLYPRRNINYADEYSVRIVKGNYPIWLSNSAPFHFKTKTEAIKFIADKLLENQKVK
jgi:hypothetical protein